MSGWNTPDPEKRWPWCGYVLLAAVAAIAVGMAALTGLVLFFGLIAGW